MDHEQSQGWLVPLVLLIILVVVSRYLIFPAVCRSIPLALPGSGFDFCSFFP